MLVGFKYRLFQLRLAVHLAHLLTAQSWFLLPNKISHNSSFLAAAIFFALTAGLVFHHLSLDAAPAVVELVLPPTPPPYSALVNIERIPQAEVVRRLEKTEFYLQQQPTHFQLLINASLLHTALGNDEQAQFYWQRALKLHPNHAIFAAQ